MNEATGSKKLLSLICLIGGAVLLIASLALDRDIGYAYLRSLPDRAELKFVARDYFFPRQLAANEERPPLWDDIVRDNTGRRVSFPFRK